MKSFNIGDIQIPVPIVQGGMGIGISLSGLAAAVANMGGIGIISTVGISYKDTYPTNNHKKNNIESLKKEIRRARELSKGVLGVNIMNVLTNFSDMVRTSIEEGIDVIFSGAGLPLDLPKYLKDGIKTKLVPIVSSGRAAKILCQKWKANYDYLPDAFVVEGPEAGGHLGFKANQLESEKNRLENLVQEVLEVAKEMKEKYLKDIPVIAAGGIFSGADIYKILKQGAAAVQMGTRFLATEECDSSQAFKDAIIAAKEEDITIIKSPVGMPGRALKGNFLEEATNDQRRPKGCRYHCIKTCDPKTTAYCISDALHQASIGNIKDGFVFTGSNVGKVTKMNTVKGVFEEIFEEYAQAKKEDI